MSLFFQNPLCPWLILKCKGAMLPYNSIKKILLNLFKSFSRFIIVLFDSRCSWDLIHDKCSVGAYFRYVEISRRHLEVWHSRRSLVTTDISHQIVHRYVDHFYLRCLNHGRVYCVFDRFNIDSDLELLRRQDSRSWIVQIDILHEESFQVGSVMNF